MANPIPVAPVKREKGDPRPMKRHTKPDGRTHWVPEDYVEPEPAEAGPLTTETAGAIVEGAADKPAPRKRGRPRKTT